MKNKMVFWICIVFILLASIGLSYAFFGLQIEGNELSKIMESTSSEIKLFFSDSSNVIELTNIYPGDYIEKTITVENIGTKNNGYKLEWQEIENEFYASELIIKATCTSYKNGVIDGTCEGFEKRIGSKTIFRVETIEPDYTHKYDIKILLEDTGKNQNYNMNKTFTGKIVVEDYISNNCTFEGELVQGAEYVNGQYTYRYMQDNNSSGWNNITEDGWGVTLTNKDSTEPVITKLCDKINGKPIVSMNNMFANSKATSVDFSSFNTSNVVNMKSMFSYSEMTTLDLNDFDTSRVTNARAMFFSSKASEVDLSGLDTSNITNMYGFFAGMPTQTLNLKTLNTSKVTNMAYMFFGCEATELDVSGFDTSKVTSMLMMFSNSKAVTLDLSNFDTSNVTIMDSMFEFSSATSIDVSNFDTSNVTSMYAMFMACKAPILDLSSFDTSNVTDMEGMFDAAETTICYTRTQADADKITELSNKPSTLTFIVK